MALPPLFKNRGFRAIVYERRSNHQRGLQRSHLAGDAIVLAISPSSVQEKEDGRDH